MSEEDEPTDITFRATGTTVRALNTIQAGEGCTKTRVLNEAVQIYDVITAELRRGSTMWVKRPMPPRNLWHKLLAKAGAELYVIGRLRWRRTDDDG